MSMDKSLKGRMTLARHRNVLTRAERIEYLKETERWRDDSTAIALPKVAHRKAAVGKKGKDEKTQETAEGEQPASAEEETK